MVAVIGGGPAGLMAADVLSQSGLGVDLYEAMPTVGRKFLLAGKGGLNLTHSEPLPAFLGRYSAPMERFLEPFGPDELRRWALDLGVETFVGTSGRVFPRDMKAAPLLRSWIRRLRAQGVQFHTRHRWTGWEPGGEPAATVLALGGGSWARLGSTGAWVPWLRERGVAVASLRPSNCGFECAWSEHLRERFAGEPLKSVVASFGNQREKGEFVVTSTGVEGSLIYALSPALRDEIERNGEATLYVDLAPDVSLDKLRKELSKPRGSNSMAKHLRSRARIEGVKAGLLREVLPDLTDTERLCQTIKALPLVLTGIRPLDEAISSAGGVLFDELDENLMLRKLPGFFCAGEMLDWEAPTGGYLLTACLATGRAAGLGAVRWLRQ